jgi:stage II sporulation protein D
MRRKAFIVGSIGAGAASSGVARATGGLDIEDPGGAKTVRVLLGSNVSAQPRRLSAWEFSWNGRAYRGDFAFTPLGDGRTGLVNSLPLDAYLYGVVSKELSESLPKAAQETQTIAARTYAFKRLRPDRPYDVVAGESNQSYGGIEGESVAGRDAVDATAGNIVVFAGAPADIAYSACCGGHTESAVAAWGTDFPYLRGVVDPNCAGAPGFAWRQSVSLATLESALGARWANCGAIGSVTLSDIDPSGRARRITIGGDRGSLDLKGDEFRFVLGASIVRSTLLRSANVRDGVLLLEGSGFGHGVGLCQWGACTAARRGTATADILQFYFPGTSLGRT